MKDPEEVLRDLEPGNDTESRSERRNQRNGLHGCIDRWLAVFDKRGPGPYRDEMRAAVDELINECKAIRP